MTNEDLDAIEARANAATKGPCYVGGDDASDCPAHEGSGLAMVDTGRAGDWPIARLCEWNNAAFIAHAYQDIPALVNEVRRLRAGEAGMTKPSRNSAILASFVEYCKANPELRFW